MGMRWMQLALIAVGMATIVASPDHARAQAPEGMIVDDAFTYFTLENNSASEGGRPVDQGWSLSADFRMFGSTSVRSAFRFVIKQGRRVLGETVCQVSREHHVRHIASGPEAFYVRACRDRAQRITQTGDMTVEVHFVDDATDATTLLRTHQILVRSVTRVRGNGDPDATHHYVDRNGEALASIMHLQGNRAHPYFAALQPRLGGVSGSNTITMTVNLTPDEQHMSIGSSTHLRCSVDGERVEMPSDQVLAGELRSIYVVQTWGRGARDEREPVQFRQYLLRLPLTIGSDAIVPTHERWSPPSERHSRYPYVDEHPGQWECEWRDGHTVLRTFRWTVADGRVVPHAEQTAGLSFGANAFLVDTVIPQGGSPWETRVHRQSVVDRGWLGRGWQTDAGRAMAQAVPQVGEPAPAARRAPAARTARRR